MLNPSWVPPDSADFQRRYKIKVQTLWSLKIPLAAVRFAKTKGVNPRVLAKIEPINKPLDVNNWASKESLNKLTNNEPDVTPNGKIVQWEEDWGWYLRRVKIRPHGDLKYHHESLRHGAFIWGLQRLLHMLMN